jgi:hypothetical protein
MRQKIKERKRNEEMRRDAEGMIRKIKLIWRETERIGWENEWIWGEIEGIRIEMKRMLRKNQRMQNKWIDWMRNEKNWSSYWKYASRNWKNRMEKQGMKKKEKEGIEVEWIRGETEGIKRETKLI